MEFLSNTNQGAEQPSVNDRTGSSTEFDAELELTEVLNATSESLPTSLADITVQATTDNLTRDNLSLRAELESKDSLLKERTEFYQRQLKAKEEKISAMDRTMAEETRKLTTQSTALRADLESSAARIIAANETNDRLKKEILALQQKLLDAQSSSNQQDGMSEEVQLLRGLLASKEKESDELTLKVASLERGMADKAEEVSMLEKQLEETTIKHKLANEKLQELFKQQSEETNKKYGKEIQDLQHCQDALAKTKTELESLKTKVAERERDHAEETQVRENMMASLTDKIQHLQNQLDIETKAKHDALDALRVNTGALENQNQERSAQVVQLEATVRDIGKQMEMMTTNHEKEMNDTIRSSEDATTAHHQEMKEKSDLINELSTKITVVTAEFNQYKKTHGDKSNQRYLLEEHLAKASSEVTALQARLNNTEAKLDIMQVEKHTLQECMDQAVGRTNELEKELKEAKRLAIGKVNEQKYVENMAVDVTRLNGAVDTLKNQNESLCQVVENKQAEMSQLTHSLVVTTASLKDMTAARDKVIQGNKEQSEKLAKLEEELNNCRKAMLAQTQLTTPRGTTDVELNYLKENQRMQAKIDALTKQLDDCSLAAAEMIQAKMELQDEQQRVKELTEEVELLKGMSPNERKRQQDELTVIRDEKERTVTTTTVNNNVGAPVEPPCVPSLSLPPQMGPSHSSIVEDDTASVMSTVSNIANPSDTIVVKLDKAPMCPYKTLKSHKFSVKVETTVTGFENFVRKKLELKDTDPLVLGVASNTGEGANTNSILELCNNYGYAQRILPLQYSN